MEQTKMTLRIYEPLLNGFLEQVDRFFLKRDALFNHVLGIEIAHLEADIDGRVLSKSARRYISRALGELGTRTINVVVDKAVADRLNAVVKHSNLVRDAFANRLLMFLRSSDAVLRWLDLPLTREQLSRGPGGSIDDTPLSPLGIFEFVYADPLWDVRHAVMEAHGCGLYVVDLPQNLHGIACFLEDKAVPGTLAFKQDQDAIQQSLAQFDGLFDLGERGDP